MKIARAMGQVLEHEADPKAAALRAEAASLECLFVKYVGELPGEAACQQAIADAIGLHGRVIAYLAVQRGVRREDGDGSE